MSGKDEKYWKILNSCITLEIELGHLKWKLSDLQRKSKVSRTLIYYYFGKNKLNIVREACLFFGPLLSGIDANLMEMYSKNDIANALHNNKKLLQNVPALIPFYFLHRDQKNEIGELIRSYELKGIQKRKKFYPHLSDTEARCLFALQMGLSLFPLIQTLKDFETGLAMISLKKV